MCSELPFLYVNGPEKIELDLGEKQLALPAGTLQLPEACIFGQLTQHQALFLGSSLDTAVRVGL